MYCKENGLIFEQIRNMFDTDGENLLFIPPTKFSFWDPNFYFCTLKYSIRSVCWKFIVIYFN